MLLTISIKTELNEGEDKQISPWDANFLKVDQYTLFELIMAANYMDIRGLLDVTCHTVAKIMDGMTPRQLRRYFHITNDFTSEEEALIRMENEFSEEDIKLVENSET